MTSKQLKFIEDLEGELDYHRLTTLRLLKDLTGEAPSRLPDAPAADASKLIKALKDIKGG